VKLVLLKIPTQYFNPRLTLIHTITRTGYPLLKLFSNKQKSNPSLDFHCLHFNDNLLQRGINR